ncbi:hypothetical protein [Psychroserpens algicola]|uniref:DUF541 domain-containing protein n=1 Tax=Psychroserpens algicola TaxID=1719034 RepID=A0ABT0H7X5_9FLAO|nr:hypothetical protein [Psychroserpens algicola]MCK8479950.1 hypothetical protein [Psychroserpens algicola]
MKSRWYISILIITLTLLGSIASQQQANVPNQEIVLQFTSTAVTTDDTQNTIDTVKQQLYAAGVKHIQVQELQDNRLKITYYSGTDVASIKALLSEETSIELGYLSQSNSENPLPSEDRKIDYNVDVYEIQQATDSFDLDGKLALETKAEHDRFSNPNVDITSKEITIDAKESIEKSAYKFRRTIAIGIDNTSYKIPEVRAGPSTYGIFDFS